MHVVYVFFSIRSEASGKQLNANGVPIAQSADNNNNNDNNNNAVEDSSSNSAEDKILEDCEFDVARFQMDSTGIYFL